MADWRTEALALSPSFLLDFAEASGNLVDEVAGKTGTLTGSPTFGVSSGVAGLVGGVTIASGAFWSFADHTDLNLGDVFTIEVWYKRGTSSDNGDLFGKADGSAVAGYICNQSSTDFLRLERGSTSSVIYQDSATYLNNTNLHHVVFVKNGATIVCYVDGTAHTDSSAATFTNSTAALLVGKGYSSGSSYSGGSLFGLAFYKGTALTSTNVTTLYGARNTAPSTAKSASDTGSGADASVPNKFVTETGSGSDASVPNKIVTDTGSGADASVPNKFVTETGSGSDAAAATVARSNTVTDTGSGADASTLSTGGNVSTGDTGSGSDAAAAGVARTSSASDTGSGADSSGIGASLLKSGSDVGSGIEDWNEVNTGSGETGAVADTAGLSIIGGSVIKIGSDTGTGFEDWNEVNTGTGETGSGVDSSGPAQRAAPDTGEGSESSSLLSTLTGDDAGVGTEASIVTGTGTAPTVDLPTEPEAIMAAARGSRTRITRIWLCNSTTLDLIEDITAQFRDGSVTASRDNIVRWTMEAQIENIDGVNTPTTSDSTFALNRVIKIERGFLVPGYNPALWSLGYFVLEKPYLQETAQGVTFVIRGQDLMKRGRRTGFSSPGSYPAGMTLEGVVQDAAIRMGLPERYKTSWGADKVLGKDVPYALGDNVRDFMAALVRDFAGEVYLDEDAYLTLVALPTDSSTADPLWAFEPGDANFTQASRELDDEELYNHVITLGEAAVLNTGTSPRTPRGEARDMNPASPYYNPASGAGYPDLLYVHTSADITTDVQAQEVADALLLEKEMVEELVGIASAPLPFIKPGHIVSVTAPLAGLEGNLLLDSVTYPIAGGMEQTMSGKRLRSVTA